MVTAATSLALAFVVRSDSLYRSSPPHPVKLSQLARVMVVSAQGIDCTAGAIGFFSGIRLPATLIAGSSLATIFALVQKVKADDCKSRLEFGVLQMYHLCSIVAFCLSVTSIMMSTAAGTTLLVGKHNPIAHDVYHFMKREFNFEFVIVRWSFVTSLLFFLSAVGGRILLEFDLINGEKKRYGPFVVLMWVSLVSFLLSYINSVLNCWPNLLAMTGDVIRLVFSRARLKHHPLGTLSLAAFAAGILSGLREIIRGPDDDDLAKP